MFPGMCFISLHLLTIPSRGACLFILFFAEFFSHRICVFAVDTCAFECSFPSYIGLAIDKDRPKDAEIPEHRKTGAAGGSA